MIRTMVSAVVVLGLVSVAVAAPAFTLPAVIAEVDVNAADALVTVNVGASGAGAVEGLNFYLGTDSPLEITELQIDGAGTMFGSNSTGASINTFGNGGSPIAQIAFGSVTTSSGTVSAGADPVAIATVKIPQGTAPGDYTVTTDLTGTFGVASDWAGLTPDAQATGVIRVLVPEPVSAMLLLAGLPLLRRRHA